MALAFESPLTQTIPKMDHGFQRPQSALARGVQITELSDGCTNPEPIVLQESDILMEQYLSPAKLQMLTGCDNLEQVTTLELKVDTSETTLNNFGALLPNLTVLKLSGSVIPNIRDLGSSVHHLEVLWMSRCSLEELDGVSSMLKLRELYLAYNEIADISALSMLEELEILDLEGNNVDDIGQIQYLTLCTKLNRLTLDGNPICVMPTVNSLEMNYDYRQAIKRILVHLSILDDKSFTDSDPSSALNVFDADWAYLEELQKDALVIESMENEQDAAVSAAGRPTTAALKPATAYRPGSALRPSSGFRPMSSTRRPASISGGRPSSAWTEGSKRRPVSSDAAEGMESASDLTRGVVICGNPSKALRARRNASNSQEAIDQPAHSPNTQPSPQPSQEPSTAAAAVLSRREQQTRTRPPVRVEEEEVLWREEEGAEAATSEDQDLCHLMQELQSWKMEHEKRLEKIRESKAPQVFTIDHNDDSDNFEENSDLSDTEDVDFRPDSAMDRYHSQLAHNSYSQQQPGAMNVTNVTVHSFEDMPTNSGLYAESSEKPAPKKVSLQKMKDYEKSMDGDQHLLREYGRLQELERQHGKIQGGESGPRELRELRVPSAGPARTQSPRRGVSPKPTPFPMGVMDRAVSPAGESPYRDQRPRKIRIGPTGLPGSSHGQQPQIRDILTPPGLGGLVPPGGQRPTSSSLQHKIRRTLPEVPPLPSRPPPVTKS